jgi:hypothetical protein
MIPNIIHFVFGLDKDFGGKPFSFLHYLAVYSAWKVNRPDKILFHYHYEPDTVWWKEAKPYVQLNKVDVPEEVFGNPISHFAHKADIIRLRQLMEHGGVYLDLDVLCLNPFSPLLSHRMVMAPQAGRGLCNAVLLAEAKSEFLAKWYDAYRTFDKEVWDWHSVQLPFDLWRQHPDLIHVEGPYSFFYPLHDEPASMYLWSRRVSHRYKFSWMHLRLQEHSGGPARLRSPLRYIAHTLLPMMWHERRLSRAYCVHLWESVWWDMYLRDFSPAYILKGSSGFARVCRTVIGEEELTRVARIYDGDKPSQSRVDSTVVV